MDNAFTKIATMAVATLALFTALLFLTLSFAFGQTPDQEEGAVKMTELTIENIVKEAATPAPAAEHAPATAKKAKAKTHTLQLEMGENVLYVRKDSAGFFSAAVSNRTFATVHKGYATLKAGKTVKSKLFAKAKCPKGKSFCMIKIYVHGPGKLVYGNLYRIFGYENLAVRRVFQINEDLQVTVPRAITNIEPKAKAKGKEKAKAGT